MISYSSLTNSKLQIVKVSIIIAISHLIRCNYGEFVCGNIYFLKNLLSLLFGFIFFNFIGLRLFNKIFVNDKKIYLILKNMLMYICVIFSNYLVINTIKPKQIINLLTIMFIYNVITCNIIKNRKIDTHKNLSKSELIINSININIFIILLDNFIFDTNSTFSKIKVASYSISIAVYLIIKNFIYPRI